MSTATILERLTALHPKSIDLSLGRIERLLGALDNPHKKLPPVVHVAGTNGKGSTVAFLRAFCEAAGLRTHVYTSPHLVKFNERIRVAGQLISDEDLTRVLEDCETANAGEPITFFEITTAAAFLAFSRVEADIVILETGLGGRLDATNVIDKPLLTCITPVSLDHQHFLGDDVETIMGEKCGILKSGVSCVAAQQSSRKLDKVLAEAAKEIDAPLLNEGTLWFSRIKGSRRGTPEMIYKGLEGERSFPMPSLPGRHQVRNASLAIACAEALAPTFQISDAAIDLGLKAVEWPGRLQKLEKGPLAKAAGDGWELWLDGGHNTAAAEALIQHARNWRDQDLWLVFGGLNQREPLDFLKSFEGRLAGMRTVRVPDQENALTAEEGMAAGLALRMNVATADSVEDAVRSIIDEADTQNLGPGRILICGSLYLAGHVLQDNS